MRKGQGQAMEKARRARKEDRDGLQSGRSRRVVLWAVEGGTSVRIGFVTGGMRNADQYGIEGAVWKQRGGFGGAVRSTLDSGAEGGWREFLGGRAT